MKKKWIFYIVLGTVLLFIILYFIYDMFFPSEKETVYEVAVLLYDGGVGDWEYLKAGIEQAEKDYNINVQFISLLDGSSSEEQLLLLQREMVNGVDGIILAADDSSVLAEYVSDIGDQIPIITMVNGVRTDDTFHMKSSDYEMGELLGQKIIKDGYRKIAVLTKSVDRINEQQCKRGLEAAIEDYGKITYLYYSEKNEGIPKILRNVFWSTHYDSVVCLDTASLEKCSDYFKEFTPKAKLFGIGSGRKIVSRLDEGSIEAIVFLNEFNMGYSSIVTMADLLDENKNHTEFMSEYYLVTNDNLYEEEMQSLLFPVVE